MKNLSINRTNFGCFVLLLVTGFLYGCNSTTTEDLDTTCRDEASESCVEDQGDDRGYNPCLVNKKLPICKK